MRITKRQLRSIIKEEKARLISEVDTGGVPGADGIIVVDREGMGSPKDRWLVRIDVEGLVPPELYTYLSRRADWRKLGGGPKASGPTEEAARAKLDKATDKFLEMLEKKIAAAQNDIDMLNGFRTVVEKL